MFQEFYVSNEKTQLYCRKYGDGKPLLMIHGACVDCDFFSDLAEYLARHYLVCTYDRRGYGRSGEPYDDDHAIVAQTLDASAVIHSIGEPCDIIAHSAGAIIAIELALKHTELVGRIILYEPFIKACLPEDNDIRSAFQDIYDLIQIGQFNKALIRFIPMMGPPDARARAGTDEELENMKKNFMCFIRDEFGMTFLYHADYNAISALPITICIGELSRNSHTWDVAMNLAGKISAPVVYFPGAHNCPYDLPQEFAWLVTGILDKIIP